MNGLMVDPSFLEVFNFPLQKGSSATALAEPNSLVLTQQAAEKIFGKSDPIGQTLTISSCGDFIVTGVLQEFASKTHFEFEMLGSLTATPPMRPSVSCSAACSAAPAPFDADDAITVESLAQQMGAPSAAYWMIGLRDVPMRYRAS